MIEISAFHPVQGLRSFSKTDVYRRDCPRWNGLLFGSYELFIRQLAAAGITIAVAALGTWAIMALLKKTMQVRVSEREETEGLDHAEHGESAYPAFTGLDQ